MADPVADSLLEYRERFPSLEQCVHLISHSLGCVPAQAKDDLGEFFELWQNPAQFETWSRTLIQAGIADRIGNSRSGAVGGEAG